MSADNEFDESPVSDKELRAWYSVGVGAEGFSGLATAGKVSS